MIVNRFLEKLEPAVDAHGIVSLNGWAFERTHAKKNPTALKWKLSAPKPRKSPEKRVKASPVIASRFTVKDLLHSDGLEIVMWEKMLLISPRHLEEMPTKPVDNGSLNSILSETRDVMAAVKADKFKGKEALVKALLLIEQLTLALKGRPISAETSITIVTDLNIKSEKSGPTISRTEK